MTRMLSFHTWTYMIPEAYHGLLVAILVDVAHNSYTDLNAAGALQEQLDLGASGSSRPRYRADARILQCLSKPTSKTGERLLCSGLLKPISSGGPRNPAAETVRVRFLPRPSIRPERRESVNKAGSDPNQ